jgi:hypothetical protein
MARQVNLLGDAALVPFFPVTNGKLFAVAAPASEGVAEWDVGAVRVGLHCGVRACFARCDSADECEVFCVLDDDDDDDAAGVGAASGSGDGARRGVDRPAVIDQYFVAALNCRAAGVRRLGAREVEAKMRFLLRAAYEGTYAAACMRRATTLVLTCVGGGVFHNPIEDVATAMADAHAAFTSAGCSLTDVVLPLFSVDADPKPFVRAFARVGVAVDVVFFSD